MQRGRRRTGSGRTAFLPALVALGGGCGFFAGPASALELGELKVHSSLGQPLRASVAYALHPNEQIHDYCIYLKPGLSTNGLPAVGNATIALRDGTIRLTGEALVREPLLSLQLTVDCPYTPHLRREYSVFLDPRVPQEAVARTVAAAPETVAEAAPARPLSAPSVQRPAVASRPAARVAVPASGSYRVRPGDSLSVIAASIPGRNVAIWPAAEAIFAANPDAFIGNDMNRLRSGAVLRIPDSIVGARAADTAAASSTQAPVAAPVRAAPATAIGTDSEGVPQSTPVTVSEDATTATSAREAAPVAQTTTPPGEVELVPDGPFKTPLQDAAVSEVAVTVAPREASAPENRGAAGGARAGSRSATSESWSWLFWLAGSGVALILTLLLFGRKLKDWFAPAPFDRRRTDSKSLDDTDIAPMRGLPAQGAVPVARRVNLDADLEDGSGFQYGGEIDVAQDFGFSESGDFPNRLDMDLTAADGGTDVIPTRRAEEATILVSETPPQHDDSGEYDVSMIVDATKQIVENDETTKDLRAIEVDAEEDDTVSEEYTLSQEVDYKILEQDYEDELTATQALNAEIARAARALSRQFGKDEMGDTLTDTMNDEVDASAATALGEAFDEVFADSTAQLPRKDEASPDDATTVLPAASAGYAENDETTQLSVSSTMTLDDTANEEIALEVPAAENDPSVEVEIESAMIDTKKMRA